jgi:AraC-like DNA-binding protein
VHQGGAAGNEPFTLYYFGFTLSQMSTLEIDYYNIGNRRVVADSEQKIKTLHDCILKEIAESHSYNRKLCLDKAKYLLTESANSITNIAEQLKFPSLYSFNGIQEGHPRITEIKLMKKVKYRAIV